MAPKLLRILVVALFLTPAVASAQEISIAIVPARAKGGPNLKGKIRKMVERPLKASYTVLKFNAYKKAGRKVSVKGKAIFAKDSAVPVGTEAGATHVLHIEGQREKQTVGKRKKNVFFADATLIDVATGDVVYANRFQLKGKRLTPQIAAELVDGVTQALASPAEPPEPPPEEAPPGDLEPPVAPDAPAPPGGVAQGAGPEGEVVASGEGDAMLEPIPAGSQREMGAGEPPLEERPPEEPPPADTVALGSSIDRPTISVSEPFVPRKRKRWRPALHVGVGALYLSRTATLTTAGDGEPPRYEGPLPGGILRVAFYPLALGGRGAIYEGVGLHLESQFHRVETVDEATDTSVASNVIGAGGGLSFRFVFWDSETAPDFTLKVGYRIFIFPLSKTSFPGTRYATPYYGGQFTIPFIPEVGLVLGGDYMFPVATSGKLKRLGEERVWTPRAFRAEGGVRLFFDPFEIRLVARFAQWDSRFKGTTDLESSGAQYENVKLRDTMIGGIITGGVAF